MKFACDIVEERDDDGRIAGIGARWTEARTWCEAAVHAVGGVFFFASAMTGIGSLVLLAFAPGLGVVGLAAAGLLLAVSYHVFWLGWRVPGRRRELTFWRDGGTCAPWGLSTVELDDDDEIGLPQSDILSIEAEQCVKPAKDDQTIYTHGVVIFYDSGHVVHIAHKLAPDQAHRLAVSLTTALAELRRDMGREVPRGGIVAPRPPTVERVERVID